MQRRKEEYQKDLERLRDAQRKLERDRGIVQQQLEKMEEARLTEVSRDTSKIVTVMVISVVRRLHGKHSMGRKRVCVLLNDTSAGFVFTETVRSQEA